MKELERTNERVEQDSQEVTSVTSLPDTGKARQTGNFMPRTGGERALQNDSLENKGPLSDEGKDGLFGKDMGQMLGKMMKDPAMREMMRGQQKATLNMMYSGLFKELDLSSEEKENLTSILSDAQMRNMENAQGMFGEKKEGPAEDTQKLFADAKQQTEAEVKALLGDERFAQYEEYQKNIGERMQLDQLKTKMAAENLPLQGEQIAQLLQAMKEETAVVPPVIPTDNTQPPRKEMFLAENIEKQVKWMDDYNQRVLDRAEQILTPEQLKHYREFQEQQATMQKFGLNMARQMFGGDKAAIPPEFVPAE